MSEPSGGRTRPRGRRPAARSRGRLVAEILSGAAAVATIVALVLVLLPSGSKPCSGEGALLSNITVERGVTFREYLNRTNASTQGYRQRQLEMPVELISYDLRIDGFKRKHVTSRWSLYEGKTDSAVADDALRNRLAVDVEPTACQTRLHPAIWAPALRRTGRFYFKLFVYDEKGNLLAQGRSPLLAGSA